MVRPRSRRFPIAILTTCLLAAAQARAAAVGGLVWMKDSRTLQVEVSERIQPKDITAVPPGPCECEKDVWIEDRDPSAAPRALPRVQSVIVPDKREIFSTITVTLDGALELKSGLFLVVRGLTLSDGTSARGEFQIRPTLSLGVDHRSLTYDSLREMSLSEMNSLLKPHQGSSAPTVTAKDTDDGTEFPNSIVRVEFGGQLRQAPATSRNFTLVLAHPLPRGRKLGVKLTGLEEIPTSAPISVQGYPKSAEDADIVLGGTAVFASLNDQGRKAPSTFAVEFKVTHTFFTTNWDLAPKVDGKVGSDALKYPDTISVEFGLRRWFVKPSSEKAFLHRQSVYLAPVFTSDKKGHNQQIGASVAWEPVIESWYQPMKRRRLAAAKGMRTHFGWVISASPFIEAGSQLKSENDRVDGTAYGRLGARLNTTLELDQFSLVIEYAGRRLLTDELLVSNDGVVTTSKGGRHMLDIELGRSFGPLKIAAKYLRGSEPPAFTHADSLTLTLKALF